MKTSGVDLSLEKKEYLPLASAEKPQDHMNKTNPNSTSSALPEAFVWSAMQEILPLFIFFLIKYTF